MRVFFTLLAVLVLSARDAEAQGRDLVRVRAGHPLDEEIPMRMRYRYEQFQVGRMMFVNGKWSGKHKFNYDFLTKKMLGIQPTGDTVVVTDMPELRLFLINEDTFFHVGKNRYMEVLAGSAFARLAVKESWEVKGLENKLNNGYGTANDGSLGERTMRNAGNGIMGYDQDILLGKSFSYFLIDPDGASYVATKSRFLRLFPDKKKAIQDYLDKKYIDFKSREDLLRLFEYCIQ